jgi:hypothetical protein
MQTRPDKAGSTVVKTLELVLGSSRDGLSLNELKTTL